jgi:hypothetical protein
MPAMFARLNRLAPWMVAALALAARLLPTPRTIDDAYITFRYARNLLAGQGFVYNAGEQVLGTTTPLYTLLLAGLAGLTGWQHYPWLALLVNSLADSLTCLLLVALASRLVKGPAGRVAGLGAALLWAVSPMSVTFAVGGMETSVFILLLAGAGYFYLTQRLRLAALAGGLLLLTRPDGLLLGGLMASDHLLRAWRSRRPPLAEAGVLLASLAPWVIFAGAYFGSPVPHSVTAKVLAYRLEPEAGLVRLVQHYGTPFFEHEVLGRFWPLAGVALYLALGALGALAASRHNSRAWVLAAYPWLYFAVFAAANPLIFRWYLAPPLPFYFLFILIGLSHLIGRLPRQPSRAWLWLPVCVFFLLSLRAWTLRPDHGPQTPAPRMAWHRLELDYTQVGRELAMRTTPDTIVAAGDVGALGYYSNARILDTVGLISPEALDYYPLDPALYVINYAVPPDLVLDYAPDYLVVPEVYVRAGLLRERRFTDQYELAWRVDSDIYGSEGILVWQKR